MAKIFAPAAVQPAPAPEPAAEHEEKTCKIPADHYLTHLPKHPKCDACQIAKMQFRPSRRSDPDKDMPAKFGEQVTLDHIVTLHPDALLRRNGRRRRHQRQGYRLDRDLPAGQQEHREHGWCFAWVFGPRRDPQSCLGGRFGRDYWGVRGFEMAITTIYPGTTPNQRGRRAGREGLLGRYPNSHRTIGAEQKVVDQSLSSLHAGVQ